MRTRPTTLRVVTPLLPVVIPLLFSACDRTPEAQWAGTREVVNGVEIVRNPANPVHATGFMTATELWSAPAGNATEPDLDWVQPLSLAVDDNHVHVIDRGANKLHVIDRESGRWTHSFGERGQGPGEFDRVFGVAASRGEVIIGNGGRFALERFTPDGNHLGSIPAGGITFVLHSLGPDSFFLSGVMGSTSNIRSLSRDSTLAEIPLPSPDPALADLGADCARASADAGMVYRLDCTRLAFQVIEPQGTLQRTVLVDRPAARVSDEVLEAYLGRIRSTMLSDGLPADVVDQQITSQRNANRFDRRMRNARAETGGDRIAVWEQTSEAIGGGTATLNIFSGDGEFHSRVEFADEWTGFAWRDSTVYALVREESTGLVRVVAYRLAARPLQVIVATSTGSANGKRPRTD
jgi:hypothetical protein